MGIFLRIRAKKSTQFPPVVVTGILGIVKPRGGLLPPFLHEHPANHQPAGNGNVCIVVNPGSSSLSVYSRMITCGPY